MFCCRNTRLFSIDKIIKDADIVIHRTHLLRMHFHHFSNLLLVKANRFLTAKGFAFLKYDPEWYLLYIPIGDYVKGYVEQG